MAALAAERDALRGGSGAQQLEERIQVCCQLFWVVFASGGVLVVCCPVCLFLHCCAGFIAVYCVLRALSLHVSRSSLVNHCPFELA